MPNRPRSHARSTLLALTVLQACGASQVRPEVTGAPDSITGEACGRDEQAARDAAWRRLVVNLTARTHLERRTTNTLSQGRPESEYIEKVVEVADAPEALRTAARHPVERLSSLDCPYHATSTVSRQDAAQVLSAEAQRLSAIIEADMAQTDAADDAHLAASWNKLRADMARFVAARGISDGLLGQPTHLQDYWARYRERAARAARVRAGQTVHVDSTQATHPRLVPPVFTALAGVGVHATGSPCSESGGNFEIRIHARIDPRPNAVTSSYLCARAELYVVECGQARPSGPTVTLEDSSKTPLCAGNDLSIESARSEVEQLYRAAARSAVEDSVSAQIPLGDPLDALAR